MAWGSGRNLCKFCTLVQKDMIGIWRWIPKLKIYIKRPKETTLIKENDKVWLIRHKMEIEWNHKKKHKR